MALPIVAAGIAGATVGAKKYGPAVVREAIALTKKGGIQSPGRLTPLLGKWVKDAKGNWIKKK